MLIGNAENLMKSVLETLKAAESASVKVNHHFKTQFPATFVCFKSLLFSKLYKLVVFN